MKVLHKGDTQCQLYSKFNSKWSNLSSGSSTSSVANSLMSLKLDKGPKLKSFDDYQLVGKIGEGFFADVFVVQDKTSDDPKPLVMKQTKANRPNSQLENEVRILSKINHLNVLSLEAELSDRQDCAVFELCPDGDLSQHIDHHGTLDIDTTKNFSQELIDGVAHLHSKNIVHCDIKAENILLSGNSVRIGDFGGAVEVKPGEKLTALEGSPINCAPEMIKGEGYNFPRDWWSVGVTIFQMITGDVPFDGNDQMEVFVKILLEDPEFPKHVDEETVNFIKKLLHKEPDTRATAEHLYDDEWLPGEKIVPSHRSSVDSGIVDSDYDIDSFSDYDSYSD